MTSEWTWLESTELDVAVDPNGAQLSILRDRDGRDLLWNGDPAVWKGRAPLLFPIVGALSAGRYRLGSSSYALPRHGFARDRRFELVGSSTRDAEFRLAADHDTLAVYPFRFALGVRFELAGATLSVITTIRNEGDEPMPASFGFHPAFRWPLPFGRERHEHFMEFEREEPAPMRRLDSSGLLSAQEQPTPISERRLTLVDGLFREDALIFDRIRSRSVLYGARQGPRLRVSFPDTPYLGVWTKPGAQFICIEPWHGLADPQGFAADFVSKPGIFQVSPADTKVIEMSITLLSG